VDVGGAALDRHRQDALTAFTAGRRRRRIPGRRRPCFGGLVVVLLLLVVQGDVVVDPLHVLHHLLHRLVLGV